MARKKRKTSKRRGRRSMSGVGTGMTSVLSMVAGAVIGRVVATKLSDKVNSKVLAFGQIGAGIILPRIIKNKFVSGIGTGMIINGAMSGLSSFGVISAINGVVGADEIAYEYMGENGDEMSGTDELQSIAGYTDEGTLTGTDRLQSIAAMDMMDESDEF